MRFPTTSKTLIDKLASGEEQPWREFFDRYQDAIRDLGDLRGLSAAECDDLVQEVMKRFLTRSKTLVFDPEKARFRTIFGRIISGIVVDIKRRRPREAALDDETLSNLTDEAPPPDRVLDEALLLKWRSIIRAEILAQLRAEMTPLNYSIFESHVLQKLPAAEVARNLGVSAARVYLVKSRAMRKLGQMVRAAMDADPELRLSVDEF